MSNEPNIELEELGRLLAMLPPAPRGFVEAAQSLPRLRAGLDRLVERAEADAEVRARLVAHLEQALEAEGIEPTPPVLAEARRRLGA